MTKQMTVVIGSLRVRNEQKKKQQIDQVMSQMSLIFQHLNSLPYLTYLPEVHSL